MLAPDDEEAKVNVIGIQNLVELRQRVLKLDEAIVLGSDDQVVEQWGSISPLLPDDVLSNYDKQIADFEEKIKQRDSDIKNLKALIAFQGVGIYCALSTRARLARTQIW